MSYRTDLNNELCRICSATSNLIDLQSPQNEIIHENLQSFVFIDVS